MDLDRYLARLLTFGKGVHFCLGSHLARAEMQVSLSVLRGPRKLAVAFNRLRPADTAYE